MMASINFYVGAYYLFFYAKRRQIKEHLPFSLLCLSVCLYDLLCVGLYNAASLQDGIFWQRLQLDTVVIISIFLIWFTAIFTEQKRNLVIRSFNILLISILVASFFAGPQFTLNQAKPLIKVIHLKFLPEVIYYEGTIGIIYQFEIITSVFAYLYLLYLYIDYYRKTGFRIIFLVIGCQLVYFAGIINDSLVSINFYSFIYLSEYSFFFIIMAMACILLDNFVKIHKAYEELNINLERKVDERTSEILRAQEQVKQLEGIIPICMYCKKIRDDQESWHQLEKYISMHSEAEFSHSICPVCLEKVKMTI